MIFGKNTTRDISKLSQISLERGLFHRGHAVMVKKCAKKCTENYKVVVLLNLNLLLFDVLHVVTIQTEEPAEQWYIW